MLLASTTLAAATVTEVWRVDRARSNVTINFTDRSGADQTIRLWLVPNDIVLTDDHAWLYDRALPANMNYPFPLDKVTLELGTKVWAYASGGSVSINIAD